MKKNLKILNQKYGQVIVGLLVIVCIFFSFYVKPFVYIALGISALYIALTSIRNSFCVLLLLLPFAQIFKPAPEGTSFFTLLEIFLLIKFFVKKEAFSIDFILIGIGFPLYVLFCSMLGGNSDFFKIFKVFVSFSIIYFFIKNYNETDIECYAVNFCTGLSFSVLLGFYKELIPGLLLYYSDLNLQYIDGIQVLRFSATFKDPNYFSIAVVCALGLILCVLYTGGFKFRWLFFALFLLFSGVQTYSKSFVLMLCILLIVFIRLFMGKNDIKKIASILFLMVCVLFVGLYLNFDEFKIVFTRFNNASNIDSLTSGRNNIWDMYMTHILDDPRVFVFGEGIDAPYIVGAAHNMYIETIYYVGVFGLVLYLLSLFYLLNIRKIHSHKFINYYMILLVGLMYVFLNGFTAFELPFYVIVSWMILNTNFSNDGKIVC